MGSVFTESGGKTDRDFAVTGGRRQCSDSGTAGTGSDDRTGTDTGAGGSSSSGTGEKAGEKRVSQLVVVENNSEKTALTADQKREERNRKRRERYAQDKLTNGGSVKPRKVNQKKKDDTIGVVHVEGILKTVSVIVASRPGSEHWLLTDSEISQLATPIAGLISDMEKMEHLAKYSNQVTLLVACVTIFAPRIVLSVHKMEVKKRDRKIGNDNGNVLKPERENKKSDSGDGTDAAGNHADGGGTKPFVGLPVY